MSHEVVERSMADTDLVASGQFIMLEYEALDRDLDKFWAKYSKPNGQRMSYTDVRSVLKRERKHTTETNHAPDANEALAFYGGTLNFCPRGALFGPFQYFYRGAVRAYSTPAKVAEVWRKLRVEDKDVCARLEPWRRYRAAAQAAAATAGKTTTPPTSSI